MSSMIRSSFYATDLLEARVKRVDFLSTVLMFDSQKKMDGGSRRSGSDGSPEGAASTLLAPPPRDQDQEEASRTLVLVSTGNGAISPLDGQGTLGAVTPQAPDEVECGALMFTLRQGTAATVGRSSSPPLAKVERTFVHIAETTHRIVMMTGKQLQQEEREGEPEERKEKSAGEEKGSSKEEIIWERPAESQVEVDAKEKDVEEEGKKEVDKLEEDGGESIEEEIARPREKERDDLEEGKEKEREEEKDAINTLEKGVEPEALAQLLDLRLPSPTRQEETQSTVIATEDKPETVPAEPHRKDTTSSTVVSDVNKEVKENHADASSSPHPLPQRRSRIPVLISEEETGSDRSTQTSPNQSHRRRQSRRPQLARLVLERKRSTQSTTASEDDTHQSDESARAKGDEGSMRSRIPRPVTPVKKVSVKSGSSTAPRPERSISFVQARSVSSGIQKSASVHSSIHQQKPRPLLYPSKTLPPRTPSTAPTGFGPSLTTRTALRTASRSTTLILHHSSGSPRGNSALRTDSPSPQRFRHEEQRLLSMTQSKSKSQDTTQKKGKVNQTAAPPKGKREPSEAKSKSR